jgi:1-acyl-sn-glycerol-3-phosphate acyltransferase
VEHATRGSIFNKKFKMSVLNSQPGQITPLTVGIRPRIHRPLRFLSRLCFSLYYHLEVTGTAHLPNIGAFVLLPKHQRWQDIPLLGLATPQPLYYVAKHELFQGQPAEWLLKALGGIPLNRQRPLESRRYIQATVKILNAGEGVVVFPEGTYFRNRMGPGQVGMVRFILARMTLPFIPVGIRYANGNGRIRVEIRFGKPIMPDPGMPVHDLIGGVMREIALLSELSDR